MQNATFALQATRTWLLERRTDESGASLAEYGLILSLVALIALGALALVGGATTNLLTHSSHAITAP